MWEGTQLLLLSPLPHLINTKWALLDCVKVWLEIDFPSLGGFPERISLWWCMRIEQFVVVLTVDRNGHLHFALIYGTTWRMRNDWGVLRCEVLTSWPLVALGLLLCAGIPLIVHSTFNLKNPKCPKCLWRLNCLALPCQPEAEVSLAHTPSHTQVAG